MSRFRDTFTRSDGALGDRWSSVAGAGGLSIISSAIRGASTDMTCLAAVSSAVVSFAADQEASVTIPTLGLGDFGGPAVRINTTTGDGYFIETDGFNENTRGIYRIVSGVRTRISTVPIVPVAGSVVRLRVVGSLLTSFVDDVEIETVTDTSLASGQPGVYYWRGNTGATTLDDFSTLDDFVQLGSWASTGINTVPIVLPLACPLLTDRALEVRLTLEVRGSAPTSISVAYGGVTCLAVPGSPSESPDGVIREYAYYLLDASLPAVGAHDVEVLPSGGADYSFTVAAAIHSGVRQGAPEYHEAGADPSVSSLLIPPTGAWTAAHGDASTAGIGGSLSSGTFSWPTGWAERWDIPDSTSDSRGAGADRTYGGNGSRSIVISTDSASRLAGAVIVWRTAAALQYVTSFIADIDAQLDDWAPTDWRVINEVGGSGGVGLPVNATEDALSVPFSGDFTTLRSGTYRLISLPVEDFVFIAPIHREGPHAIAIMARMPDSDANTGYILGTDDDGGGGRRIRIWRRVAGVDTLLVSVAGESSDDVTLVGSIVGTNPVELEVSDGTGKASYSDTSVDRLESGTPGVFSHHTGFITAASGFLRDLEVVDLTAASSGGATEATPASATASWVVPALTITLGAINRAPAAATSSWSSPAQGVTLGVVNKTPASSTAAWSVPTITVALSAINRSIVATTAAWSVPSQGVALSVVNRAPTPAMASWVAENPVTSSGFLALLGSASASWSVPSLTITLGTVNATPTPAESSWAVPNVGIALSTISRTLSVTSSSWSTEAIAYVLGAVSKTLDAPAASWVIPSVVAVASGTASRAASVAIVSWTVETPRAQNGQPVVTRLVTLGVIDATPVFTLIEAAVSFVNIRPDVTFTDITPDTTLTEVT